MRQEVPTTKFNANKNLPKPPTKPAMRTLAKVAKAIVELPYLISGTPPEDPENKEQLRESIQNKDNLYVLLKPLKVRSYLEYEDKTGQSIDTTVYQIMWYMQKINQNLLAQSEEEKYKFETNEFNAVKTEFGPMYGSLHRNIIELCTFILSRGGRVVDINEAGKFVTEPISEEDIIDHLDPASLMEVYDDSSLSPFFEILTVSSVWNMDEVQSDLETHEEISGEEAKATQNFPGTKEDVS